MLPEIEKLKPAVRTVTVHASCNAPFGAVIDVELDTTVEHWADVADLLQLNFTSVVLSFAPSDTNR